MTAAEKLPGASYEDEGGILAVLLPAALTVRTVWEDAARRANLACIRALVQHSRGLVTPASSSSSHTRSAPNAATIRSSEIAASVQSALKLALMGAERNGLTEQQWQDYGRVLEQLLQCGGCCTLVIHYSPGICLVYSIIHTYWAPGRTEERGHSGHGLTTQVGAPNCWMPCHVYACSIRRSACTGRLPRPLEHGPNPGIEPAARGG